MFSIKSYKIINLVIIGYKQSETKGSGTEFKTIPISTLMYNDNKCISFNNYKRKSNESFPYIGYFMLY